MTDASGLRSNEWLLSPGLLSASPWALFSRIWIATTGYAPTSFDFVPGTTPMSTAKETALAISSYYLMILIGRKWMQSRPAFELTLHFLIHNLFLSVLSGFLLLLFAEELGPRLWKRRLYYSICGTGGWTDRLVTLYYVNYLTKYIELIDTVFLVLKKKPMTFLHCYHHGATVLLCYTQLSGQTSVSWVPITLNLTVHVLMYWYYFESSRGVRVWWKEWITRLQILQFLIDLGNLPFPLSKQNDRDYSVDRRHRQLTKLTLPGFIYFASYNLAASEYIPWMPHVGTCAGSGFAASVGCLILTSYLALFVSFYLITYRGSPSLKKTSGAEKVVVDVQKGLMQS